ncbi:hypothetical protein [Rhodococcus spongiicola]|nr:hypothetical protein [Rhodococcus spongiicola]
MDMGSLGSIGEVFAIIPGSIAMVGEAVFESIFFVIDEVNNIITGSSQS